MHDRLKAGWGGPALITDARPFPTRSDLRKCRFKASAEHRWSLPHSFAVVHTRTICYANPRFPSKGGRGAGEKEEPPVPSSASREPSDEQAVRRRLREICRPHNATLSRRSVPAWAFLEPWAASPVGRGAHAIMKSCPTSVCAAVGGVAGEDGRQPRALVGCDGHGAAQQSKQPGP